MRQDASASGSARQFVLGSGVQNITYVDPAGEPAVSLAPPLGQRDPFLPLRGRDDLVAELRASGTGVHVVHGLGGCGKTRLALEVAYKAQQHGVEVWWISASEESGLVTGMLALGRRLDIAEGALAHGDAADMIWQRLATRREPWLLVLDNADDPMVLAEPGSCVADGRGWLRPVSSPVGTVLVTSRDGSNTSWGSWCSRHRLAVLPADEAADVLADHAGRLPSLGTAADARDLAQRLGGLPLAVKIAGSYLAESAGTPKVFAATEAIRTYRQYYDAIEARSELASDSSPGLIGRTWELSLDLLDTRQVPEARLLLRLLASFADAPIPYELLLEPATLSASALLKGITGSRIWQALRGLDAFGLIDLDPVAVIPLIRLHPLVRDSSTWHRDSAAGERSTYLDLTAHLLRRASELAPESPEDPQTWPIWQLLAPHAFHAFDATGAETGHTDDAVLDSAAAASSAARYQEAQGLHGQPEAVERRVLAVRMKLLGPDHNDTLVARHNVAVARGLQGDYAGAEAEFRKLLDARLRALGPDHPDTLATRHEIAGMMSEQGDHVGAETEFRKVLDARLRLLGPDHPDTLATRHNIAFAMAGQRNYAEAEAEYRKVLGARLRLFGPEHVSVLTTRHEVARVILERGDYIGAEGEFREVLAAEQRVLGLDHPATRVTAGWISELERRKSTEQK